MAILNSNIIAVVYFNMRDIQFDCRIFGSNFYCKFGMVLQLLEKRRLVVFFPSVHIFASVAKRFSCPSYLRIATRARRTNSPMDKVYFRNDSHSEELHINFRYVNADLKLDREFNFSRRMSEKIEDVLTRIRGNIEKEIFKKAKKGKNKSLPQESELLPKPLVDGKVRSNYCNCLQLIF